MDIWPRGVLILEVVWKARLHGIPRIEETCRKERRITKVEAHISTD
jgi:hypothetical protein